MNVFRSIAVAVASVFSQNQRPRPVYFLLLPADLQVLVLREWLAGDREEEYGTNLLRTMIILDVACCNRALRPALQAVFAAPFHRGSGPRSPAADDDAPLVAAQGIEWSVKRNVSIMAIEVSAADTAGPWPALPAVEHITLQHITEPCLTHTLKALHDACPSITSLKLVGRPSEQFAEHIRLFASGLRRLSYSDTGYWLLPMESISALTCCAQLQSLDLDMDRSRIPALLQVLSACPQLSRLSLTFGHQLELQSIQDILSAGQRLQQASFKSFESQHELAAVLPLLSQQFPSLDLHISATRFSDMGYCRSAGRLSCHLQPFQAMGAEEVDEMLSACPSVFVLKLQGCNLNTAATLERIGQQIGNQLLDLSLSCIWQKAAVDNRLCLLAHCSRLQRLTMKSGTISDDSMQQLAACCPLLENVKFENIQSQTLLGDVGMIALFGRCKHIKEVRVMCRNSMTYLTLQAILLHRSPVRGLYVPMIGERKSSAAHIQRFRAEAKRIGLLPVTRIETD